MASSSKRVWVGSVALTGVLLLTSLAGVNMPVKAAEHPDGLETILNQAPRVSESLQDKVVSVASTSIVPEKKPAQVTQVAVEVKKSEPAEEAKTKPSTQPQSETTKKVSPKPQVASTPTTSQVSRGGTPNGSTLVKNAQSLLGVPYVFGGTSRSGFDCSGLTQYVFKASGISLPRTSQEQFKVGTPVNRDQLQPGDLVFFTTYAKGASHVGIYAGGNQFIHAGSSGVQTTSLSDSYYAARYLGARRVK